MVSNSKAVKGRVEAIGTAFVVHRDGQQHCRGKTPGNLTDLGRAAVAQAVLHGGLSIRAAAKKFGIAKKTVEKWKKHGQAGEVYDHRPGHSGRKRRHSRATLDAVLSTKPATNRIAVALYKRQSKKSLSVRMIRKVKKELGYVSRVRPTRIFLSAEHAQKRVEYAKQFQHWTAKDWEQNVLWTDETKGEQTTNGVKHQILKAGEQPQPRFHFKTKVSVMLWGGMTGHSKLPMHCMPFKPTTTPANDMRLKSNRRDKAKKAAAAKAKKSVKTAINSDDYIENVLKKIVLPFIKKNPHVFLLHDNAPCHGLGSTNSQVHAWLVKNKVKVMPHPPSSPDLNMIEFVWRDIKQNPEVALCKTKEEIEAAYRKLFDKYSLPLFRKYCAKMPAKLKKVIDSNGYDMS